MAGDLANVGAQRLQEMVARQFVEDNPNLSIRGLCKVESVMAPHIAMEPDHAKRRKLELDTLTPGQVRAREKEYAMREIATGEQYAWNRYMLCNVKMEEIPLSEAKPELQAHVGYKPVRATGRRSAA